jgi:hypothetical protein
LRYDIEPSVGEYPGNAFPEEHIVLADRHAQGRRRIGGRHRMSPAFDQLA